METIKIEVIWMLQKDLSIKRLIKNVLWHKMGQNILRDRATNCAIWKACEVFFFFSLPSLNWKLILKIGLRLWRPTSFLQYDFQYQRRMISKPLFRQLKWDAGTQATVRPSVLLSWFAALKCPDCVITDVRYLSQGSSRCLPREFPTWWLKLSPQPGLTCRFGGPAPQFISTTPKQAFRS